MKFIIIDGTFVDSDGSKKAPGQTIELGEEMAKVHAARIRPAPTEDAIDEAAATDSQRVQAPAFAAAAGDADVDLAHP